jgi:hydroxyacylglutathione hydrolase
MELNCGKESTMAQSQTICLALPFGLGTVNCYLATTDAGFVLVDTGSPQKRLELEAALERAGCRPGNLQLIVLTHGDFDHIGNAAYLRQRFGAPVAMHGDDVGMAERGDMFWNRQKGRRLLRALAPLLFGFGKSARFRPDVCVEDGEDLSGYGLTARVLHLPGHSEGSIGILTADGDLFCGDLLDNVHKPARNAIMDDPAKCDASLEKLASFHVGTVYPGHGRPFFMEELMPAAAL